MIKNIIFDFGNVLFDLELGKLKSGLHGLMDEHGRQKLQLLLESGFFKRYETGRLDTASFLETLARCPAHPLERSAVEEVWNSIFVDFPYHRLEMLLRLREKHKVFLLSNINDLHLTWIHRYLEKQYGITDFESRFLDKVYYSHLIGLRKPDLEIYEYVLSDAGIRADESIFFDDLEENIEAAEQCGIKGAHHEVGREITEHLRSLAFGV